MITITIIGKETWPGSWARAIAGRNTVETIGRDSARAAALVKEPGGSTTAGTFGSVPEGDIVIVALPYESVAPVVRKYGPALQAKVMVDIS
jgi:8-hydroxy-5-deazaflavin:NADPH oxidoreductase